MAAFCSANHCAPKKAQQRSGRADGYGGEDGIKTMAVILPKNGWH